MMLSDEWQYLTSSSGALAGFTVWAQQKIPKYVTTESILGIIPSADAYFVRNIYDHKNIHNVIFQYWSLQNLWWLKCAILPYFIFDHQ